MDMTGERLIRADKEKVWAALNDTEILKTCIPGCETLEAVSPTEFKATAGVKLGPIAAKFAGRVTLSDLDPPNGYTISGEGQGGVAGFAKGGAKVGLAEQDDGTMLVYAVNAQVGGKITQLGARLIDATAKSMAEQFFQKFAAAVEPAPVPQTELAPVAVPGVVAAAPSPASEPLQSSPVQAQKPRLSLWLGTGIAVVVILALIWRFAF